MVGTIERTNSQAAAATLAGMAVWTSPEEKVDPQKLHGAIFDGAVDPISDGANARDRGRPSTETCPRGQQSIPCIDDPSPDETGPSPLDRKIDELLDQIGQGFLADDSTNFEKLTIALKNGSLLWDLKALVPHGSFKATLRERFPKVNYAKCNRWMFLASQQEAVAAAIEKYPGVAWGPKKMIDFLKEHWLPEEEAEDDEEDCYGYIREAHIEEEPLIEPTQEESGDIVEPDANSPFAVGALNPELAEKIEQNPQELDTVPPGETAGPVLQAVRTTRRPRTTAPANQPATNRPVVRPAVNRTEYEVEVRLGFKLSVPANVTAEEITEAIRMAQHWTFEIETPFEYELSEQAVVIGHVQPWNGLDQFEPEVVPQLEAATE